MPSAIICGTASGPGDTIEVAAPRGAFVLRPGSAPVVLLSAGIGVTPVLAMLHALTGRASARQVWWAATAMGIRLPRRPTACFGPCLTTVSR